MNDRCEEFRRALGRVRDGEAAAGEAQAARAHAASCAACGADAAMLDAVGDRLRERAGADAPLPGLRESVLAGVRRGDAVVLEIRPFLFRAAAAAAAVLVVSTTAAVWQTTRRASSAPRDAGLSREEILAEIVLPRPGLGTGQGR